MSDPIPSHGKVISLLVVGALIAALFITPAGAHVGGTAKHLWRKHLLPMAKNAFYTKSQANARFVRAAQVRSASMSCAAVGFQEREGADETAVNGASRYMESLGNGTFYCNMPLPQGARLTAFRVWVDDSSATELVHCYLVRRALDGSGGVDLFNAGTLPDTTPGEVELVDTTADPAASDVVVDGDELHYAECGIQGFNTDISFRSATVDYTITAADGTAS